MHLPELLVAFVTISSKKQIVSTPNNKCLDEPVKSQNKGSIDDSLIVLTSFSAYKDKTCPNTESSNPEQNNQIYDLFISSIWADMFLHRMLSEPSQLGSVKIAPGYTKRHAV